MLKKNIFSILIATAIMYLSLTPSDTFDKVPFLNIPHLDKIVHLGMYFVLMSSVLYENIRNESAVKILFLISLIPFGFGILIEVLQAAFTVSRSGSFYDILANTAGILLSVLFWIWLKPYKIRKIR